MRCYVILLLLQPLVIFQIHGLTRVGATQIVIISNSTTITAGSIGMFMCTASGYPLPALSWSRGGVSLNNGSRFIIYEERVTWSEVTSVQSTLEISSVEPDDAAQYTCVANNTFSSAIADFNLTVNRTCT